MAASLKGKFLVAGSTLRDPNFFKTVILVIEHAPEGTMGLVINRPSSLSVRNALAGHLDLPEADQMVFVGGPVEPADLFLLHTDASAAVNFDGPEAIVPGLFVTNTADQFDAVLTAASPKVNSKVFSGYAGWGPNQLENELSRGDWLIASSTVQDVFETSAYQLWDQLTSTLKKSHRIFSVEAPNPELN